MQVIGWTFSLLIGLAASCRPATPVMSSTDVNFIAGDYLPHNNTKKIVVALMKAGVTDQATIENFLCIANGESNMGDLNFNGSCCYGLFQINSTHKGTDLCPEWKSEATTATYAGIIQRYGGISRGNIAFFDTNAKCAKRIRMSQGWNAWESWGVHCGNGSRVKPIPQSIMEAARAEAFGLPTVTETPAMPSASGGEGGDPLVPEHVPQPTAKFSARIIQNSKVYPKLDLQKPEEACEIKTGAIFPALSVWQEGSWTHVSAFGFIPGVPSPEFASKLQGEGRPFASCPYVGGWFESSAVAITSSPSASH